MAQQIDNETQKKIQELQIIEQNIHSLIMQKQAFQIEISETENAINEISNSNDDVFKIVGNIMIKADKIKTLEDLKKKKDLFLLRLKSINSEEKNLNNRVEELKKEIMSKIK